MPIDLEQCYRAIISYEKRNQQSKQPTRVTTKIDIYYICGDNVHTHTASSVQEKKEAKEIAWEGEKGD